jgi:sugar O-acyltransferase (sialic acid O-acetyltransferase NeuD family)
MIFPCNGNAVEALDCLGAAFRLDAFVDDEPRKQAAGCFGHRVLPRAALAEFPSSRVLAVPGSPASFRMRQKIVEDLGVPPDRFARVVHPAARISPLATIGHNVLIMAGVVVTANAVIGNHVCVLPNTVIHHDAVVGDWSLVGANVTLAGHVTVGWNCYLGSGTSVMNGITIGDGALVGLGSNVIRFVPPGTTVAGNPARLL